ncbi:phosphotransferase [Marmoricola sp. RAF53]|uniref:phosphotransferase n=1 Tax=Marmoricola sp. RAF53 TaxID=3233059 RepID=UPI003F98B4E2
MTVPTDLGRPLPDVRALLGPAAPSVLIETGRADALTFALAGAPATGAGKGLEPLTVKVATCPATAAAVERETRMLVELRRRRLGRAVETTIPRYVGTRYSDGLPAVVTSTLPGRSMAVEYDRWMHTARPGQVRRDYWLAGAWLARFQDASFGVTAPSTWVAEVGETLERRWSGHPALPAARSRLARAAGALDGRAVEHTVAHGDFTFENLLVGSDGVTGVLNWSRGELEASPLRDLGRFAVTYSAALDRGTRPGASVLGHPGLRRMPGTQGTPALPGLHYTLLGRTWYARVVRAYLTDGLVRLGLDPAVAGDVFVAATGEVAATSHEPRIAEGHLTALADLPE